MKKIYTNIGLLLTCLTISASTAMADTAWSRVDTFEGLCSVSIIISDEIFSIKETHTESQTNVEMAIVASGTESDELSPTLHKMVSTNRVKNLFVSNVDAKTLVNSPDFHGMIESILSKSLRRGGSYSRLINADILISEIKKCNFK